MTLIAGIKLPNGILLVSDTRTTNMKNNEIISDFTRKITMVSRRAFLATAGTESTFLVAKILRTFLFNADPITYNLTENILELYHTVNKINERINQYSIGPIMLAEYNKHVNDFILCSVDPVKDNPFLSFKSVSPQDNIMVIGSNEFIRTRIRDDINSLLIKYRNRISEEHFYEPLAIGIMELFHYFKVPTIGRNVYATYLTQINNESAWSTFFIREDKKVIPISHEQDGELIELPDL